MKTFRCLALVTLLVSALPASSQEMEAAGMGPPPFLRELFLPALVMQHQREIGLTTEQRDAITKEMTAAHQKVLQLRWGLEEKSEGLAKLLAADKVDEKAAVARSGELMDVERQMKQAHLELLIRIKNQLTPEQQAKLRELRPGEGHFGRRMFRRGGPEE